MTFISKKIKIPLHCVILMYYLVWITHGLIHSLNFNNFKPSTKRRLNEIKISLLSLGVKSSLTTHNFPRHNIFSLSQKGYRGTLATSAHVCEIMDKFSFQKKKVSWRFNIFFQNFVFEEKKRKNEKIQKIQKII